MPTAAKKKRVPTLVNLDPEVNRALKKHRGETDVTVSEFINSIVRKALKLPTQAAEPAQTS